MSKLNPEVRIHILDNGSEFRTLDTDDMEEVVDSAPRGDFALIGWSYEKRPPDTYFCLKCGTDRFLVGKSPDALLTVLKCPNCGWERCVHDG